LTAFADSGQAAGRSFQQSYSPKSGKLSPSPITLGLFYRIGWWNEQSLLPRSVAAYGGCRKFVAAHWIGDRLLRLTGEGRLDFVHGSFMSAAAGPTASRQILSSFPVL
jgi:hypothetical protein